MKLNLGCGERKLPGYVNVDIVGDPDVRHNLEAFPWPWADRMFEEIVAIHVLEHLGADPGVFIGVMKEIYRVALPGATVRIIVPHPRHDDFLSDPTHVRAITPMLMKLFSRRMNLEWRQLGASNSTLALHHGVDFELRKVSFLLDEFYRADAESGRLDKGNLDRLIREANNVVKQTEMVLEVIKPGAAPDRAGAE